MRIYKERIKVHGFHINLYIKNNLLQEIERNEFYMWNKIIFNLAYTLVGLMA